MKILERAFKFVLNVALVAISLCAVFVIYVLLDPFKLVKIDKELLFDINGLLLGCYLFILLGYFYLENKKKNQLENELDNCKIRLEIADKLVLLLPTKWSKSKSIEELQKESYEQLFREGGGLMSDEEILKSFKKMSPVCLDFCFSILPEERRLVLQRETNNIKDEIQGARH